MPELAIETLPEAYDVINQMPLRGLEWSQECCEAGREAMAAVVTSRMTEVIDRVLEEAERQGQAEAGANTVGRWRRWMTTDGDGSLRVQLPSPANPSGPRASSCELSAASCRIFSMVKKRLGSIPRARLVSEPTQSDAARLLMARLEDLERRRSEFERWLDLTRSESGFLPVVFLGPGTGKPCSLSLALVQAMAALPRPAASNAIDPYLAPSREAARRLVLAHSRGAERELIASTSVDGDTLYVWSCEPRLYRCHAKLIPALANLSNKQLADFELSPSGSRLTWPAVDVDINLDTIRAQVDPRFKRRAEADFRRDAARYAKAMRALQKKLGLRQGDISGLSERQVRRLEQGETFPHIKTVEKLARAHGMSVADYLKELATLSKRRSKPCKGSSGRR